VLCVPEDEVFQIKKPSHSKRIVKQLKKESLKDKDEATSVKFEVSFGTEQVCLCMTEGVLQLMSRIILTNFFNCQCEAMHFSLILRNCRLRGKCRTACKYCEVGFREHLVKLGFVNI